MADPEVDGRVGGKSDEAAGIEDGSGGGKSYEAEREAVVEGHEAGGCVGD